MDSRINTQALVHWAGRFDHQFPKDATWGLWFWQLLSIRTGSLFFHSPTPNYSTFEMVSSPPKTEVEKPKPRGQKHSTSCWFQTFFIFPYLGKRSNLTKFFQMGWNHQLVKYLIFAAFFFGSKKSRVSFGRAWTGPTRGWTGSTALGLFDGLGQRGWGAKEVIETDELRLKTYHQYPPQLRYF